ncbi:MAG: DUF892 family protein [Verrucomicrobiota bacterium]|nr:DUF892 family protein [Verrucomicrobiota bacterium]
MTKYEGSSLGRFLETLLRHLYSAENQTFDQLAVAIENASLSKLKDAFNHHRKETAHQIERLKKVFKLLELDINKTKVGEAEGLLEKGKEVVRSLATMSFVGKSQGMEGLIEEQSDFFDTFANTELHDLALAIGGQAIEAAEIAAYNLVCRLAEEAEQPEVLKLLEESLEEEKRAHETFSQIAEEELKNRSAA